ncbi:MIP/aquaporin family protein [Arthrobacter oryzae]|uniref:MIP family channel protein n=1 Tax=Arthrobacter oryzae TaxID=409290 RepID=A0A495ENN8_9MICC|nr:aquaporin [Arthrobacter oryzae]RKR18590.1 MIP family channel protein [Arthrobacter oryzae]
MTLLAPAPDTAGVQPASDDSARPGLVARLAAEAFGTLLVVVAGLGVLLFTLPQSNPLPAALAAGVALTAAMLAVGYVSGGHFNPAITVGNAIAGRMRLTDAAAYIGAQLVGAVLGAVALFGVLRTVPKIDDSQAAFATVTAGFGEHSIIQVPLAGVLLVEVLGTALLVAVFLATTARRNPAKAAAPFAVGLTAAMLLQLGQAIGNVPFNPARATASAIFSGPDALGQLWLFWVAPVVGAAIAGLVFRGFAQSVARPASPANAGPASRSRADTAADTESVHEEAHKQELTAARAGRDAAASTDPEPAAAEPAGAARRGEDTASGEDEARSFFDRKGGK